MYVTSKDRIFYGCINKANKVVVLINCHNRSARPSVYFRPTDQKNLRQLEKNNKIQKDKDFSFVTLHKRGILDFLAKFPIFTKYIVTQSIINVNSLFLFFICQLPNLYHKMKINFNRYPDIDKSLLENSFSFLLIFAISCCMIELLNMGYRIGKNKHFSPVLL